MTSPDIFISPDALNIMSILGHPIRSAVLNGFHPDIKASIGEVEQWVRSNRPRVQLPTLHRMCAEMEDDKLLERRTRGVFELTPYGVTVIEASRAFHNSIKVPLFDSKRPTIEYQYDKQYADRRERDFLQTDQPTGETRIVMGLLSHPTRVRMLLVLSETPTESLQPQLVLDKVSELQGKEIPSIYKYTVELERRHLLKRLYPRIDPQLIIIPLGVAAVEGFVEFQKAVTI